MLRTKNNILSLSKTTNNLPKSTPMPFLRAFLEENKVVINPPKQFEEANFAELHLAWRWAYLVAAWLVISVILGYYGELLTPIVPDQGFYREFVMCAGQVVFQTLFIGHLTQGRLMHYLGNMMTVSLIGSLILLPVLLLALATGWEAPGFYTSFFMLVVVIIILIHKNRVERLGLHWLITVSWVAYRCLLLGIIYWVG